MGKKDRRVDAYIEKSPAFARPILRHLRNAVHEACPEAKETIRWGFPHFDYRGILCSMAAFQGHCSFGFWKAPLMEDPYGHLSGAGKTAMGNFGKIQSVEDLPTESRLEAYVREAARLNEEGITLSRKQAPPGTKVLEIPADFAEEMQKNRKALKTFEGFSYSNKRDYVEWVAEAKSEATRKRRLATSMEWMAEGKVRNWKYIKK